FPCLPILFFLPGSAISDLCGSNAASLLESAPTQLNWVKTNESIDDGDTSAARGAGNRAHRSLNTARIQVRHLELGNLFHLLLSHFADFRLVRFAGTFFD